MASTTPFNVRSLHVVTLILFAVILDKSMIVAAIPIALLAVRLILLSSIFMLST